LRGGADGVADGVADTQPYCVADTVSERCAECIADAVADCIADPGADACVLAGQFPDWRQHAIPGKQRHLRYLQQLWQFERRRGIGEWRG
jgi:hypothetical protein